MNIFGEIDDRAITKAQWRIVAISGIGFFTDAYDLFVIGDASVLGLVLTLMLLPEPNGQTLEQASRDRTFELAPGLARST